MTPIAVAFLVVDFCGLSYPPFSSLAGTDTEAAIPLILDFGALGGMDQLATVFICMLRRPRIFVCFGGRTVGLLLPIYALIILPHTFVPCSPTADYP